MLLACPELAEVTPAVMPAVASRQSPPMASGEVEHAEPPSAAGAGYITGTTNCPAVPRSAATATVDRAG